MRLVHEPKESAPLLEMTSIVEIHLHTLYRSCMMDLMYMMSKYVSEQQGSLASDSRLISYALILCLSYCICDLSISLI